MNKGLGNSANKRGNSLNESLQVYLRNWRWFVLSLLLSVFYAFTFIRYATPTYRVQGKIQIVEDASSATSIDLYSELNVFGGQRNEVLDEIEIIKSRSNLIQVVQNLGLNTVVYSMGNFRDKELYTDSPIKVSFNEQDSIPILEPFSFYVDLSSDNNFAYSEEEDSAYKTYAFGKAIISDIGAFVITPDNTHFEAYRGKKLRVEVKPVADIAEYYRNGIKITQPDPLSNILALNLIDANKEKARDILDDLIEIFNTNAVNDKQEIANRTSQFIDDRIATIYSNLSSADQDVEDVRRERGIVDPGGQTGVNLQAGAANRQELASAQTQLNIASSMKDIIDQGDGFDVLPANIGLNDGTVAAQTQRYNQLVQDRQRLLQSSTEKSPIVQNLDGELRALKRSIQSSLSNSVNSLELQVNTLSQQRAIINSQIYSQPSKQRALRDITRRQQTTEQLYLYLLQKREEAQIAVASTAPKSKVIDKAYFVRKPVSPNKKIILLAFGIIGLTIPFTVIYIRELLDDKVHNMHSLQKVLDNIPVLGELPRLSGKEKKTITAKDRSTLGEALRIIRTNIDYLIKTKSTGEDSGKNNVIFVSSSVSGEGKTFLSVNLAMIMAAANKKVLLIGADVRNPKFRNFFEDKKRSAKVTSGNSRQFGLTDYLYDYNIQLETIVNHITLNEIDFDVVYSGRIPPNPAELLMSGRLKDMFPQVSEYYDYVIVDTSPLMLVSDTLLISQYADHFLYVTRAERTELKNVEFPVQLQEEGKISGLAFIVNDVKSSNLGYGGKYGYGYGKSKRKWWKF